MLGVDRDGSFAELVVVPTAAVLPLPAHLSWRRGAFVEPLAAAMAVLGAPITKAQRGRVLGSSRIAELTRRVLHAAGFQEAAGPCDFVIDTDGTAESLRAAMDAVVLGGCVLLKSRPFAPVAFDIAAAVRREITFHAVNYGSFRVAASWLAEDRVEVDDLFDEPAPLEDFARVFQRAEEAPAKKQFFSPQIR
jgi:threonine dehydrogenase-like Zn-dependent dehydrogenase